MNSDCVLEALQALSAHCCKPGTPVTTLPPPPPLLQSLPHKLPALAPLPSAPHLMPLSRMSWLAWGPSPVLLSSRVASLGKGTEYLEGWSRADEGTRGWVDEGMGRWMEAAEPLGARGRHLLLRSKDAERGVPSAQPAGQLILVSWPQIMQAPAAKWRLLRPPDVLEGHGHGLEGQGSDALRLLSLHIQSRAGAHRLQAAVAGAGGGLRAAIGALLGALGLCRRKQAV